MSRQRAEDAFSMARQTYTNSSDGSPEEAQATLAMALAAHAIALYDNADAFRAGPPQARI